MANVSARVTRNHELGFTVEVITDGDCKGRCQIAWRGGWYLALAENPGLPAWTLERISLEAMDLVACSKDIQFFSAVVDFQLDWRW